MVIYHFSHFFYRKLFYFIRKLIYIALFGFYAFLCNSMELKTIKSNGLETVFLKLFHALWGSINNFLLYRKEDFWKSYKFSYRNYHLWAWRDFKKEYLYFIYILNTNSKQVERLFQIPWPFHNIFIHPNYQIDYCCGV